MLVYLPAELSLSQPLKRQHCPFKWSPGFARLRLHLGVFMSAWFHRHPFIMGSSLLWVVGLAWMAATSRALMGPWLLGAAWVYVAWLVLYALVIVGCIWRREPQAASAQTAAPLLHLSEGEVWFIGHAAFLTGTLFASGWWGTATAMALAATLAYTVGLAAAAWARHQDARLAAAPPRKACP